MKNVENKMQSSIKMISKAYYQSYRVTISSYDTHSATLIPYHLPGYDFYLFFSLDAEIHAWISETQNQPDKGCIYTSPSGLVWMYFSTPAGGVYLGPIYYTTPSLSFLKTHRLKESYLPVIEFLEFFRLCNSLYCLLNPDTDSELVYTQFQSEYSTALTEDAILFGQNRDYSNVRILEKYLTSCVQNGDVEKLGNMAAMQLPSPARLATDNLRDAQNRFIVTITLAMRAAVDGGLPAEIAYPLSDVYLFENETLTSASQVMRLMMSAILDYANRVRNCQKYADYGSLVKRCCSMILANFNVSLRIAELAQRLDVCPEHLSRQFKKETGQSILDYIQSQKTEEAIRLLKYTNMELIAIAMHLGYNSQSQFSEKFKKSTGMPPAKYRKNTLKY